MRLEGTQTSPQLAEERKIVSVLFADLVGFTGRAETLDPEDVRGLLAPYYARLREELQRFGGTVEKFIGDAVVGLFGAPVTHEDDPERAVRAALAVREAITELNRADPSLRLQVRIAVTTGEAVIDLRAQPGKGEGMATGDVVNTCARLQSLAPVDGILVDEATHRATREAIDYRECAPVRPKGKTQPLAVWEAVAPRARLGVDIAFRGGAPLIGRREELDLLLDTLARARRERSPQLVTLVGVPGVGKSRLVFELFARIESQPELITWRQGRSLPYGEGVSLWALGEMVKAEAGILETDSAEQADEKLGSAVAGALSEADEAAWVLGHLRPLAGLARATGPGADGQDEAFAAWRRFFEALAERRPVVLVFEDAHWADDGLLDFVDHLVDWATAVPLLVVCTARPELLERRPEWAGGKRNAVTLSLSPLPDAETAALLEALAGEPPSPELVASAGGNPLYAEEYARMLAQTGNGGRALPDSVQGIIAARLDTLPIEEKALLQNAAVVGKVFWPHSLAALGALDARLVDERLRALDRKEFVRRERRSSVAGQTAYVFRHVLVGDVAYAQIPRARRAEKHRLAAEWLESLATDRSEDVAEMLAHHYVSALEYCRATGADTAVLEERARAALRHAGDRAAALNAFAAAERFYRAALEHWPEDDPERPQLLFRHGRSLFHSEGAGADELAEAAARLVNAGDLEAAAEAEIMLGEVLWTRGERGGAFEHFESATALLAAEPASRGKTYVIANVARFLANVDQFEDAIRNGFAAFQMAEELGLDELGAHTLITIGVARVMIGDLGGLVDLERGIEIAHARSSPEAARGYLDLASMLANLGDLEKAFELYATARREAERFGDGRALRWLAGEQLHEYYWRGLWDEALASANAHVAEAEVGTRSLQELDARIVRARIRLARGDVAGSLDDSASALAYARSARDPQMLFPALAVSGYSALLAGNSGEAIKHADELLRRWRDAAGRLPSFWLVELAFVLAETEDGPERLAEVKSSSAPSLWVEAAVAITAHDWIGAAGVLARIGASPEEAYARLRGAANLRAAGRRSESERERILALDFYRRVRADGFLAGVERAPAPS
jgi:class 3 adenylate cyclase/tetratricopeptide (TPR) repeat protein